MGTRSGRHFRIEKEPREAADKETDKLKTMNHDISTRQHRESANVDTKSVKSKSTKSSSIYGSSTSSAAMKARDKIESDRALLAYANKESELLKQKAALDADMLILQSEKVNAASAEAAVYDEDQPLGSHDELRGADIYEVNSNQRISDYIQHHFSNQAALRNPIITQTRAKYRQETEDLAKYLIRKDLEAKVLNDPSFKLNSSAGRFVYPERNIANKIPPVDPEVQILLLLGRDVLRAHRMREHINGPHDAPYDQRLHLGWVIVGEVCLGTSHQPKHHVFKTSLYSNGRTSLMKPCSNMIQVKERIDKTKKSDLNITGNRIYREGSVWYSSI
ncbi:hypothetical protein BSL78_12925 [Apostichopus japonicus]|uniref:Uncharacterized protein n=1 Tax=Stichopus japonicus TaxID=307972 RepID=A0A2G8KQF6_STIJA|nr:hypothetical protein BSL78_12925 [Apostichopus japonicus]